MSWFSLKWLGEASKHERLLQQALEVSAPSELVDAVAALRADAGARLVAGRDVTATLAGGDGAASHFSASPVPTDTGTAIIDDVAPPAHPRYTTRLPVSLGALVVALILVRGESDARVAGNRDLRLYSDRPFDEWPPRDQNQA